MANDNANSEMLAALRAHLAQTQQETQHYRGQVYRNLGVKRVNELALPPLSLSENTSESERLQEMIVHAERERDIYRNEAMRMPIRNEPLRTAALPPGRGGCLTAWLALMSIALGLVTLSLCTTVAFSHGSSYYGYGYSDYSPSTFLLQSLIAWFVFLMVHAIAISGMWRLQKWGYYLVVGFFLLRCLIYAVMGMSNHALISPLVFDAALSLPGLAILSALVFARWYNFE